MREAIRQRLLEAVPQLNGQVFEVHQDVSVAQMPYLLIAQGADAEENDWSGFKRTYEIWPYMDPAGGFAEVDGLVETIVQALDEQVLSDTQMEETFALRYRGTVGGDTRDEAKGAITRGIRFSVSGLPSRSNPETSADDGWLAALKQWSETWLGESWQVHLTAWPLGGNRPSLLWRVQEAETEEAGPAAYEMRKRIVGHFWGSTRNEEMAAVFEAIGRLQAGTKIALDADTRTYLKVTEVKADLQADGLTAGQIAVTLSRRMNRYAGTAPLIRKVGIHT